MTDKKHTCDFERAYTPTVAEHTNDNCASKGRDVMVRKKNEKGRERKDEDMKALRLCKERKEKGGREEDTKAASWDGTKTVISCGILENPIEKDCSRMNEGVEG